ncbi:MAG TPA: aminoacyl-tRNA hydrolase [Candidatus Omnitrophota bacterium]|nr:aminoacyl-tRNA hydrolase [Candidatus Omnitrophota bacterium]HPT39725.1 aminoacyl-tRNA hydrolase [Candidatus Omnitrophota bacterium]
MISDGTKLIVGLGNPGLIYAASRHNIGFRVLKSLAGSLKINFSRDRLAAALVGKDRIFQQELILALPQTYMNLSGIAVCALVKKFKIDPQNLLVVCDDLDLELGVMKIRPQGSSGGQRGLESIIERLGTRDFCRLRVGIGRPPDKQDAARYVLSGFLRKEKTVAKQIEEDAAGCCLSWLENGIEQTMNTFNTSFTSRQEAESKLVNRKRVENE